MLSIDSTGLRTNEYISGIGKQTKGTIIQVKFPENVIFPAFNKYFDSSNILIRDRLNYGFFKDLSFEDRLNYIATILTDKDIYLSEVSCELRFISLGAEFTTKLTPEHQQILMNGNWIDMNIVYNMFPKKIGSNARRHTLIFRGDNWEMINHSATVKFEKYFDTVTNTYTSINNNPFVYKVDINTGLSDTDPYTSLDMYISQDVKSEIDWFSPSLHKSLIQKCIRVRPKNVQIGSKIFDTQYVIMTSFCMLLQHPGAFVSNIQKFVTGAESAFKRLAVSLIEDSTCNYDAMQLLFSAALASRNNYKPSLKTVEKCLSYAISGLNDSYFVYDWHNILGIQLHPVYQSIVNMLKELGSFESDINMLITLFEKNMQIVKSELERPEVMDLYHCLDHHSITEIAFFYSGVEKEPAHIFKEIWDNGTGINSRKKQFIVDNNVKIAQFRLWYAKTTKQTDVGTLQTKYKTNRNLSKSWIAGIIGPIENKSGTDTILSFFNPDNLGEIISIRKPSRNSELVISDDLKRAAAYNVENNLNNSWSKLKSDMLNIEGMYSYRIGKFYIYINNIMMSWDDYCVSEIEIPITLLNIGTNDTLLFPFFFTSNGVLENWKELITNKLQLLERNVLYKLAVYLRNITSKIAFNKISRNGKGTYLSVNYTDCLCYQFLLELCNIIPGVISVNNDLTFKIKVFEIWNEVREMVFDKINNIILERWTVSFNDTRELQRHQIDAVNNILSRIDSGKRGNILFFDVGLGKTLIALKTIGVLIDDCKMPKYCIFCITPSSLQNIVNQIQLTGIPINMLNGNKDGNKIIYPNCINLIYHDHLRLMKDELMEVAPDSFFIFDEFHYMFEDSKRTSASLELSKICNLFIGMTGTLIKGKNIDGNNLLDWVSQVVDFEITKDNFMIGIASLITGKLDLGIKINYIHTDIPINDSNYLNLIDNRFGGNASQTNFSEAAKYCFELIGSYLGPRAMQYLSSGVKCVFIVAQNKSMQQNIANYLKDNNIKVECISKDNPISITPSDNRGIQVVITTTRFDTGYDITAATVMLTAPWFVNQSIRTQLEGRLVRLSQTSKEVLIETMHCGILTYVMNNHNLAKELAKSISDIQKDV